MNYILVNIFCLKISLRILFDLNNQTYTIYYDNYKMKIRMLEKNFKRCN